MHGQQNVKICEISVFRLGAA